MLDAASTNPSQTGAVNHSSEAGSTLGWGRYVGLDGAIIGLDRFGGSAPGEIVMRELGFTPEQVVEAPNP